MGSPKETGGGACNLKHPNLLTRELKIPLGIETDYRWVHIFNELSAHESPGTVKHEQGMLPRVHDPEY